MLFVASVGARTRRFTPYILSWHVQWVGYNLPRNITSDIQRVQGGWATKHVHALQRTGIVLIYAQGAVEYFY